MKRFLQIIGILVLIAIGSILLYSGWLYISISLRKDTHNLSQQIDRECQYYLDRKNTPGLALALVKGDTILYKSFGVKNLVTGETIDTSTLFELGDLTIVFTTSLAELHSRKGLFNWNDHLYNSLPADRVPSLDDGTTLLHLATHTGGFPRIQQELLDTARLHPCNPFEKLYRSHSDYYYRSPADKKAPGWHNYQYSEIAISLLGDVMEYKAHRSYENLLVNDICAPLGMKKTSLILRDSALLAKGHDINGNVTCNWHFPVLQASDAIRSNIVDMSIFLKAQLFNNSSLYDVFHNTHQKVVSFPIGAMGKGWNIDNFTGQLTGSGPILWHGGCTGGFSSYMAFCPEKKTGIVLLANQNNPLLEKMGLDLLNEALLTSLK
ncbi:MAG TPA: serine hydrolase domain-containing protein [Catalimonadaceae bacterium]|nr:serine hydrolase domain-containing protein [Catalimonadaceae bacterium]